MPERVTVTSRARGGASRAKGAGQAAFDRLMQSVEAAQAALEDVRKEVSTGTRDVLRDIDATLNDASRSLRSVSETVATGFANVQQALTTDKPPSTRSARPRRSAATAPTARKATPARKGTAARSAGTAGKATPVPKPRRATEATNVAGEQEPLADARAEQEPGSAEEQ